MKGKYSVFKFIALETTSQKAKLIDWPDTVILGRPQQRKENMENWQQISYTSDMSKSLIEQSEPLRVIPDADLAVLCRQVREEEGCTQLEMAQRLGVSEDSYANWERGRTIPNGQAVYKLLKIREERQKLLKQSSKNHSKAS